MKTHTSRMLLGTALATLATTLLIGCNKAPDTTAAVPTPPTTMGTQVDDTVITTSVKSALLADPDIKSFDISVATVKGEVQLSGMVNNQGQIDQAAQIARAVAGTSGVKNDLTIKP
jgi:hyperosmotically inducible protein